MKWQAQISVGLFGREVYTQPRRWKWLADWDANDYCLCQMRATRYRIVSVDENTCLIGEYLRHDDGGLVLL